MNIITPLPEECYLACSGGVDSMFALHFLRNGRRKVHPIFFNHGTKTSNIAEKFLVSNNICSIIGKCYTEKTKKESPEEYFRNQRYIFFSAFTRFPIITCHHLNDQVETWLLSALNGKQYKIPYKRDNFLRPFLNVTKKEIYEYANRHELKWVEDESNLDCSIPRNHIRHNVIPQLEKLNPSFYKHHITEIK